MLKLILTIFNAKNSTWFKRVFLRTYDVFRHFVPYAFLSSVICHGIAMDHLSGPTI
jgi:hypothetical protein